jgi:hypothetical protein
MQKTRILAVAAMTVLCSSVWAGLKAQDQGSSPSEAERMKAVQAVRLINTAEIVYSSGSKQDSIAPHGHFGSWKELNESGAVKTLQGRSLQWKDVQLSPDPQIMPGWYLDLIVPADGQSWSVALHDKRDGDGLFSVFSDATGIIYLGAPMK